MNKASKKKAEDQVKAIPNQIIGLEKAKVDIDTSALELQEKGIQGQIAEKEKLLAGNQSILDEYQKAADGIMDVKFKMSDIERKAMDDLNAKKKAAQEKADKETQAFNDAMREQSMVEMDINRQNDNIERDDKERKGLGADYKALADQEFDSSKWIFDEHQTACPMCGREYDTSKVDSIKAEFDSNKEKAKKTFETEKQAKMQKLIDRGNALKDKVTVAEAEVETLNIKLEELKQQKMAANKSKTEAMEALAALPEQVVISDNQEYEALQLELSNMEKSLESMNNGASYRIVLKEEIEGLRQQLSEVSAQIAKASNNADIDKQISDLRQKQREQEQAKADAEKILHQLSLVSTRKNEMLVEEINSNFSIVKWKLFTYLKNTEYKEVCIPQIDNKDFGDCTNTRDEIIAKLYPIIHNPKASSISMSTLTSLIDYIKSETDTLYEKMIVHVESPTRWERYMEHERFCIALQAKFKDDPESHKALVLQFAGTVEEGTVAQYGDDGVTQKATVKTGIASKADAVVPNPIKLRPYRTFYEVEQPMSDFIFRMKSERGIECALFEADGGAWKNEAMSKIKHYLQSELQYVPGFIVIA